MHINDKVFRPNEPEPKLMHCKDHDPLPLRQEPMSESEKKFGKGNKVILGWIIDTLRGTFELPPHRKEGLLEMLGKVDLTAPSTYTFGRIVKHDAGNPGLCGYVLPITESPDESTPRKVES
jgi:hypothetical protein